MNVSIDFSELTLGEKIGISGDVQKALWRNQNVVVKKYFKPAEREIKQLKNASHKNIVFVHGVATNEDILYLVMEYMDGGSLESLLHSENKTKYYLAHVINWAFQLAEALVYLHDQKPKAVIHRDISPRCIHLTNNRRDLKIFDFTHVRNLSSTMTRNVGTGAYKAPEIFKGEKHSEKSDVYSWAITLWEMLAGKKPFENIYNTELGQKVIDGERPPLDELMDDVPKEIINLMTDCWSSVPNERKSMNQVVAGFRTYYNVLVHDQLSL